MRHLTALAANVGIMLLIAAGMVVEAAEIKVLSAGAMNLIMEDLGPKFERASGHKLAIRSGPSGTLLKRIQGGETADVVITSQDIDRFVKEGRATAGNVTVIARSGVGVAVRKGDPKPDISSPESLKRTLLAAKSITYTNPAVGGASGIHFAKVLDRLGIANEMRSKTVFPKTNNLVGVLVANGEAELGVQQFQNLISVAGIEYVGPLPDDLQATEVFAAAIMARATDLDASKALVSFLRSPEAGVVMKARGMEPVTP